MAHRPPDRGPTTQGPAPADQSQIPPSSWPQSQSQSQSQSQQTHELAPSPSAAVSAVRDTAAIPAPPPYPSSSAPTPSASATMTMDVDSGADVDDRARRATSVLSMDDIEAAQALEGLRSDSRPSQPPAPAATAPPEPQQQRQPEPLLSLLTSTHPLISSAINGSMSAYTSSKSYSPRFKYGAEFLERNIGSHVANTVGTISQKTGVEGGLRWALQRRETSDTNDRNKRRKVGAEENATQMDVEKTFPDQPPPDVQRARSSSELSYETLPPYDDQRSPKYEEVNTSSSNTRPSTWQSRLMISTSGLGVAMSEESLRSLTYCLKWLRWANDRLSRAIVALKNVLQKWDESRKEKPEETASNRAVLSQHIQAVKEDVLRTLKQVVDIVSKYTGGALPENARNLVRRHLISLPQRFRIASLTSQAPSGAALSGSDEATSAHRVLVLAQEGLDMMAQVSRVVNDTLVSAEVWCERLGRKRLDMKTEQPLPPDPDVKVDVKQEKPVEMQDVEMGGTAA